MRALIQQSLNCYKHLHGEGQEFTMTKIFKRSEGFQRDTSEMRSELVVSTVGEMLV